MESYCPTCELVGEVEAAEDGAVMCLSCGDSFLPVSPTVTNCVLDGTLSLVLQLLLV